MPETPQEPPVTPTTQQGPKAPPPEPPEPAIPRLPGNVQPPLFPGLVPLQGQGTTRGPTPLYPPEGRLPRQFPLFPRMDTGGAPLSMWPQQEPAYIPEGTPEGQPLGGHVQDLFVFNPPRVRRDIGEETYRFVEETEEEVYEVIDSVHGTGNYKPKRKVQFYIRLPGAAQGGLQTGAYFGHARNGRLVTVINPMADPEDLYYIVAHEFGHLLDNQILIPQNWRRRQLPHAMFASQGDPDLWPWFDAVTSSQAFSVLAGIREMGQIFDADGNFLGLGPVVPRYIAYLLQREELFARSYAQWIITESGNDRMVRALQHVSSPRAVGLVDMPDGTQIPLPIQWTDADFQEIFDAFEVLFRKRGLRS